MARPLRLEFPGALYHITARGNRGENTFETDDDRNDFISLLGDVCHDHNWVCYAYCLMNNHYHLLIETPEANLSKGMRQLNGVYTQKFNRRQGRGGHVFQGRFKAILVDKDRYLQEVARYIVLNPARAGMARSANEWRWSSYRATIGRIDPPPWLRVKWLLATFGRSKSKAIDSYKKFVAQGKGQKLWDALNRQIFLGDDTFVEQMQEKIGDDTDLSEIPMGQKRRNRLTLDDYQRSAKSRDEAIVRAHGSGAYSLKDIGDHFGLHYSRISRIVKEAKDKTRP